MIALFICITEAKSYSCFCELMKRMSKNFPHGGAMDTHFANMRSLIQVRNILDRDGDVVWCFNKTFFLNMCQNSSHESAMDTYFAKLSAQKNLENLCQRVSYKKGIFIIGFMVI